MPQAPKITASHEAEQIKENLVIGPPDVVAEKIARYAALGIDNLQLNMNFGAPHAQVLRSLELFARRVIPAVGKMG